MKESEKVRRVAKIIRNRFPNLSVEETISISYQVLESLEEDGPDEIGSHSPGLTTSE